jgi:Amt family ammonium transporter
MAEWDHILGSIGLQLMLAGYSVTLVGYARRKNSANTLMMLASTYWIGALLFWAAGHALARGASAGGVVGGEGFFRVVAGYRGAGTGSEWWFHMLATTLAGSVAVGGMVGRARFGPGLVFIALVVLLMAFVAHWTWNPQGWLFALGFHDFGGSATVHLAGGSAALAATWALGPRAGRFTREGLPNAVPAHNLPMSVIGMWLFGVGVVGLLLGRMVEQEQYGEVGLFGPGESVGGLLPFGAAAANVLLAQGAGALAALSLAWGRYGKPDVALTVNGAVAGLVSASGAADVASPVYATLVGGIGGLLVVAAASWLDRWEMDDVGGVVPVHGFGGAWGTLATGLIHPSEGLLSLAGPRLLGVQALGTAAVAAATFGASGLICLALVRYAGLRATAEDEADGLDHSEHRNESYPDFQRSELK